MINSGFRFFNIKHSSRFFASAVREDSEGKPFGNKTKNRIAVVIYGICVIIAYNIADNSEDFVRLSGRCVGKNVFLFPGHRICLGFCFE